MCNSYNKNFAMTLCRHLYSKLSIDDEEMYKSFTALSKCVKLAPRDIILHVGNFFCGSVRLLVEDCVLNANAQPINCIRIYVSLQTEILRFIFFCVCLQPHLVSIEVIKKDGKLAWSTF